MNIKRLPLNSFIRLVEKFQNSASMKCLVCKQPLEPEDKPVINNKHHFNYGIIYKCSCGKARVWCNSIRNPQNFIKDPQSYREGFCNDLYCGYCFSTNIQARIKNGYTRGIGVSYDLLGCRNPKCPEAQSDNAIIRNLIKDNPYYAEKQAEAGALYMGNFILVNSYGEYKEDSTPPQLIEFYKSAVSKYGPSSIGVQ